MLKPSPVRPSSKNSSKGRPEHSIYATDSDQQQQAIGAAGQAQQDSQGETGMSIGSPHTPADQAIQEEEDGEVEGEQSARIVKSPGTPSAKERQEHEVNHWPYRSWCDHCVKGRALGQPHRTVKGDYAESSVARVLMDYGYLHEEETITSEEHGQKTEAKVSMTAMVMLETMCSNV